MSRKPKREHWPFLSAPEIEPSALQAIGRADLLRYPAAQRVERVLEPKPPRPKTPPRSHGIRKGARILPDLTQAA
jgi:hypothetical protein